MNSFTRLALLLCLTLATSSYSARAATIDEQTSARLDALEKENSALRARVNRLEAPKAAKIQNRPAVEADPAFASAPRPQNAGTLAAYPVKAIGAQISSAPHFEISGSLLYLQPGAGDLEYGTLVTPFPIATPNWNNQSLTPKFSPAFTVGARYIANAFNDIELSWTHLNSTTNGAFSGTPTQMVGPPFLIGPE